MKTITNLASFFLIVNTLGATCALASTLEQDRQAVKAQKQVVHTDHEKLKSDVASYGKHSPQAKADRAQLRKDRKTLNEARQQAHSDHKQPG